MKTIIAKIIDKGQLTNKEALILRCLCEGMIRKEIAEHVCRSLGTVSKHLENIAVKMDAHSAAEIVAKAVANKMVNITIKAWLLVVFFCNGLAIDDIDMRRPPVTPRPPITRHHTKNHTPRFQRET